jgi:hypothetical protein
MMRFLLLFLTLFASLDLSARSPRTRQRTDGLLDSYPGAAAAYVLRPAGRQAVFNPILRVVRSSDSAARDVMWYELRDGTLTTWTGANNGAVATWYDVSRNGRHATQATSSNRPRIVNAGVVDSEGGHPSIRFFGSTDPAVRDWLTATTYTGLSTGPVTLAAVGKAETTPLYGQMIILRGPGLNTSVNSGVPHFGNQSGTTSFGMHNNEISDPGVFVQRSPNHLQRFIAVLTRTGGNAQANGATLDLLWRSANGNLSASGTQNWNSATTSALFIGTQRSDTSIVSGWDGFIQSAIVWPSALPGVQIRDALNVTAGVYTP